MNWPLSGDVCGTKQESTDPVPRFNLGILHIMKADGIVIAKVVTLGSIILKNTEMFRRLICTIEWVTFLMDND